MYNMYVQVNKKRILSVKYSKEITFVIDITDNTDKKLRYFSFHFPLLGWGLCVQRGLSLLTLPDIKGGSNDTADFLDH